MIHYILQTVACQLLFLLAYDLLLKRATFFTANRWYLLVTPILSMILPLIQIAAIRESIPNEYVVQLPAIILGEPQLDDVATTSSALPIWAVIWGLGAAVSLSFLMVKLIKLRQLRRSGTVVRKSDHTVVILPDTNAAFTFFRTVYLGADLSESQRDSIYAHELVHVQQRHTLDLMVFEALRILFWFNPLVYIYQRRMVSLQEYTADAKVTALRGKAAYYQQLLEQVFQTQNISFINTFFNHSLIKNRIVMLQKSRTKKIHSWRYLLLLPMAAVMIFYASCSEDATAKPEADSYSEQIANLRAALEEKETLTQEEKNELAALIYNLYPEGTQAITGENGKVEFVSNVKHGTNEFTYEGVPFATIDRVPVFPGCEGLSGPEAKKCFTTKITEFVVQNFNTKVGNDVSGKQRIVAKFQINKQGKVTDIIAKANTVGLQNETERVLELLPTMQPGQHEGKIVAVDYVLPIIFAME